MAAGATYTPIATTTLGSAQSSITFSSISGSYTDLVLILGSYTASANNGIMIEFNGDTGTNYSATLLAGNGSATTSGRTSNSYGIYTGNWYNLSSTEPQTLVISINNYSNSTTYKTLLARYNYAGGDVGSSVGLWRSTAAINSIKIYNGTSGSATPSGNLNANTTATLYGILAA